jgi:hypothetical protein
MSTNLQIIEDALRDINVISEIDTASAEQGAYGLRKLNQLMELLKERDVDLGWFAQISTAAASPIPDWAEMSITNLLSVALAPKYGATVSAELAVMVSSTANTLSRKMISEKLKNADMSHQPWGSGWTENYRYDINTDQ